MAAIAGDRNSPQKHHWRAKIVLLSADDPGYQVPFASRDMPMPYGVQVTAAIIGPADFLKVIDHGADDTTNAVSIRKFFEKTVAIATTTAEATVIQIRHRIPERPVLLLDEPTASLDARNRAVVVELIERQEGRWHGRDRHLPRRGVPDAVASRVIEVT